MYIELENFENNGDYKGNIQISFEHRGVKFLTTANVDISDHIVVVISIFELGKPFDFDPGFFIQRGKKVKNKNLKFFL